MTNRTRQENRLKRIEFECMTDKSRVNRKKTVDRLRSKLLKKGLQPNDTYDFGVDKKKLSYYNELDKLAKKAKTEGFI